MKIDLTCPRCAAIMILDEKHESAKCEYCGHQIILEKKESVEEMQRRQEAKSYAYHTGKYKAKEEAEKRASRKSAKGKVIGVLIFLALCVATYFYMEYSKPLIEDPFQYLDISFSGEDGDGEMSMNVRNEAEEGIDMARVEFHCESDDNLKAGDIVVVEASSEDYRLGTTTKRYTVEGLEMYLSDVALLSDKQLDAILEDNIQIQTRNNERILLDGETLDTTPIRLICQSGDQENTLYLISEISFQVAQKKYYSVSEWDDVIVRNSEVGTIDLGYGLYTGDILIVDSPHSAMLYEEFESAVREVEGRLKGNWKQTELNFDK